MASNDSAGRKPATRNAQILITPSTLARAKSTAFGDGRRQIADGSLAAVYKTADYLGRYSAETCGS
ncbi:MAG: hypothetical protein FWE67_11980 [Planctomycetaceae bacterium]|nr:hypothetical protein [Planctomycetaceae bacterium]